MGISSGGRRYASGERDANIEAGGELWLRRHLTLGKPDGSVRFDRVDEYLDSNVPVQE
jgi:hypothetical protein